MQFMFNYCNYKVKCNIFNWFFGQFNKKEIIIVNYFHAKKKLLKILKI